MKNTLSFGQKKNRSLDGTDFQMGKVDLKKKSCNHVGSSLSLINRTKQDFNLITSSWFHLPNSSHL